MKTANRLILPDPKEIKELLTFLLGRDVRAGACDRMILTPRDNFSLGVYVNERGQMIGAVVTDIAATSWMGAALSLVPAHTTRELIASGGHDENLWLNTLEVYNVVSKFYHECFDGMITLGQSWSRVANAPPEVHAFLRTAQKRLDVRVDIQGYGGGRMVLLGLA